MTVTELIKNKNKDFQEVVDFYLSDIASIRTGRASPALVEDIKVNIYGSEQKIKELASISTPEPRMIVIQPWDRNVVDAINGAIKKSQLGINPVVDGKLLRVIIPSLTEERRKEYIKTLKSKTEESRIKIRRVREDIWDKIQSMEKEGSIREDDKFKGREDLQKVVNEFNKKIEEAEAKKENELMTI
jgi:ribosome recycling factor